MNGSNNISFGYNFNLANFSNVGITRTWQVLKNDYDVNQAIKDSNVSDARKNEVRNQKRNLNIVSNISQYLVINAVMLKFNKQVNRNTMIAVGIPFLINLLLDVACRVGFSEKLKNFFFPEQVNLNENVKPVSLNDVADFKKYVDQKYSSNDSKQFNGSDIPFGVSYTNVHILGKLVNKLRGAMFQTYDVYSASKQSGMNPEEVKEQTQLKFLREISSQLIENIVYCTVLMKMKKRIDKSLAMAIFVPAIMTIGIDIINRSKAFDFLKDFNKKLVGVFSSETPVNGGEK